MPVLLIGAVFTVLFGCLNFWHLHVILFRLYVQVVFIYSYSFILYIMEPVVVPGIYVYGTGSTPTSNGYTSVRSYILSLL